MQPFVCNNHKHVHYVLCYAMSCFVLLVEALKHGFHYRVFPLSMMSTLLQLFIPLSVSLSYFLVLTVKDFFLSHLLN